MDLRKLVTSLVCAGTLVASSAQALDLGALHVYSAAGDPLDAEIQLLDVEGLSADDIRPRFAGVDDLAISGLDSKRYLSDVRFFVAIENNQSATLRLVSDEPIDHSFLSFLLEVNWPQGRLLREYTTLLKESQNNKAVTPDVIQSVQKSAVSSEVVQVVPIASVKPIDKGVRTSRSETTARVDLNADKSSGTDIVPSTPVAEKKPPDSVPTETQYDGPKAYAVDLGNGGGEREPEFLHVKAERSAASYQPATVVERSRHFEVEQPVLVHSSESIIVNPHRTEPSLSSELTDVAAGSVAINTDVNKSLVVNRDVVSVPAEGVINVGAKETLWDLAHRNSPSAEYTNQQVMVALYEKNPQAFVDGDINRMKGSAVLSRPSETEILRHDASSALRAIRERLSESRRLAAKELDVASSSDEVVVGLQETLWDIAVKHRAGPEVNTRQMMLAIVKKNPHAFGGGNINRMRKGVVLKMPSVDELKVLSEKEASEEVRRQISVWRQQEGIADVAVMPTKPSISPVFTSEQPTVSTVDSGLSGELVIGKQETLWSIAINNLPDTSVTTGQMINAIIQKNPHAFVNGDMNSMRVGETLAMPSLAEIEGVR